MRRLPIRVRLTAWYTTLLVVVLAVLGAYQVQRLHAELTKDLDRSLMLRSAQIAGAYRASTGSDEFTELSNSVLSGLPTDSGAQVLTADGTVVDTSEDARHCGACGNACSGSSVCVRGVCTAGTCESAFLTTCGRSCVDTSRHPENGTVDLPTLDLLRDYRGELPTTEPLPFGIYGEVLEPGAVHVGDQVVLG